MAVKIGRAIALFLLASCVLTGGCAVVTRSHAEDRMQSAQRYERIGQRDTAIFELQSAIAIDPSFVLARTKLASLYRESSDWSDAAEQYEVATKLEPLVADHFCNLGLMDLLIGRFRQATDAYLRSLDLQPHNASAAMNLGLAYLALGDRPRAIDWLQRSTDLDARSIDGWSNLGVALDDDKQLTRAERAYRKALELPGDNRSLLINYGGNWSPSDAPTEAVQILQSAIDERDDALAEKLMGDAFVVRGWSDAALGRYQRAVAINPSYITAWNALGDVKIRLYVRGLQLDESLRQQAVDAWQSSLAARPLQPVVQNLVARWGGRARG